MENMNNNLSSEFDDRIALGLKRKMFLILFAVAFVVTLPTSVTGILFPVVYLMYPSGLAWFFPEPLIQSQNKEVVLFLLWAMYIGLIVKCVRTDKWTTFRKLYVILFVLVVTNGIGCHLMEVHTGGM